MGYDQQVAKCKTQMSCSLRYIQQTVISLWNATVQYTVEIWIIYGLVVVKSTGLHAYFRKDAANLSASGSLGFWKKKNKINRNDPLLTIFICSSINKTLNPAPNFACLPSVHNAFSHVKLNHFF